MAKEKKETEKLDEDHEKVEHEDQKQQTQKERDREEDEEEDDKDANETDKERVKEVAGNADAKKQPSSAVSIKEGTRQTREQFPVVAGYAVTVYKAQGLTLKEGVVINLTSWKSMRSREKVEHEDQKQDDEEEDDKDANETVKERVKEVTGNAHAKATQHEKRESAEEPVTKRDRALNAHTSDEVEPLKKVPKCSLLSLETGPGRPQATKKNTATGLGVPLSLIHI